MQRAFGKLVVFSSITFGLGLLQAWIAILLVGIKTEHFHPARIFSDGGLFFFAASLASSSYLSLRATPNLDTSYGSPANVMSLLLMGWTYFLALVGYLSQAVNTPECPSFDGEVLTAMQIVCVFCASMYAFYVATVSGMLRGDS
ncbi:hypothetical protein ACFOLJ_28445 [Rugamonas sp. CCM 8940]|uniref:hypothetical protein n=1 Tax=Rugamonas sp. CCM 8940 TaxID=2765359 RepID=UPI0018F48A5F|nr:hypothetical protein [Rugamonas sp. CCM 8940]MBJ7311656.1 hypothetical protein [Rugamonas sp. CCM 8940]